MSSIYREKAGILFLLCALVLPVAILSEDAVISGTFIGFFLLIQIITTLQFLFQDTQGFEEWYSFWGVIAGSFYMFTVLTAGKDVQIEVIGFLLFVIYLVSGFMFILRAPGARRRPRRVREESYFEEDESDEDDGEGNETAQSDLSDDEIEHFRRKDELNGLVEGPIPDAPKEQSQLSDYEDFRREKVRAASKEEDIEWMESGFRAEYEKRQDDGYYEIKAEAEYEEEEPYSTEGYIELYPSKAHKSQEESQAEKVKVVELKEAPQIDIDKIRSSTEELDERVSRINEKIRLIAEKAMLEGAQKKLEQAQVQRQKKALLKEKATLESASKKLERAVSTKVYASETGTRYHYDDRCLSLKRVKRKDMVTFKDSKEARKQGLKACGRCKR